MTDPALIPEPPELPPKENAVTKIAKSLYAELDKEAVDETPDGIPVRVFRGRMLECFERVSRTRRYYIPAYAALEIVSAITILEKGNRYSPTLILLHGAPDTAALVEIASEGLTNAPGAATMALEAKVNGILKMLGGIDVKLALVEHEKRIRALELDSVNSSKT